MTEKEMYDRINGTSQDTGFSINEKARGLDGTFAALMRKVYVWMTLALVITGFTAYSVANSSSPAEHHLHKFRIDVGLIIGELALVFIISGAINRLSLTTATLLFIIYSVLNGAMLSSIFIIYEPMVIAKVFFITAGTFGAMAFYGLFHQARPQLDWEDSVHGFDRPHHRYRREYVLEEPWLRLHS